MWTAEMECLHVMTLPCGSHVQPFIISSLACQPSLASLSPARCSTDGVMSPPVCFLRGLKLPLGDPFRARRPGLSLKSDPGVKSWGKTPGAPSVRILSAGATTSRCLPLCCLISSVSISGGSSVATDARSERSGQDMSPGSLTLPSRRDLLLWRKHARAARMCISHRAATEFPEAGGRQF